LATIQKQKTNHTNQKYRGKLNMHIEIWFTPLYYNGNLHLEAQVNNTTVAVWNCSQERCEQQILSFDVEKTPLLLKLIFSNKNQDIDTLIDSAGQILKDKAIRIDQIIIDKIKIYHELFLIPFVTESGQVIEKSLYFGFNGVYTVDIKPNLFQWLNHMKILLGQQSTKNDYQDFLKDIL
jgi:hypothetical protein